MIEKDPDSVAMGFLFSIIGIALAFVFHYSFLVDGFKIVFSSGGTCCPCLTVPVLYMVLIYIFLYAGVGFIVGYCIGKYRKKSKEKKNV